MAWRSHDLILQTLVRGVWVGLGFSGEALQSTDVEAIWRYMLEVLDSSVVLSPPFPC